MLLIGFSVPLHAQVMEDELTPNSPVPTQRYGQAVVLSGDLAFVGDPSDDGSKGAVYVYRRNKDETWDRLRKLTAPNGQADDEYGWSLGKSGRFLIVGARLMDSVNGPDSGAVFIYDISNPNTPPTKLVAPSNFGSTGDEFGYDVDILGTTNPPRAVVGMRLDDSNGKTNNGAVVFYEFKNGAWKYQNIVLSPTGSNAHFGSSVSITTNSIGIEVLIGAPEESSGRGAVYFYNFVTGGGWSQNARMFDPNGGTSPRYGFSVALDGEFAIVGSYTADVGWTNNGLFYIYQRGALNWPGSGSWEYRTSESRHHDQLGISVDIEETPNDPSVTARAVVGANLSEARGSDMGAVWVGERSSGGAWTFYRQYAVYAQSGDGFGRGVSVDVTPNRAMLLAGAPPGNMAQVFDITRDPNTFVGRVSVTPQQSQLENTFKTHGVDPQHTVEFLWSLRSGSTSYKGCPTSMRDPSLLNFQVVKPNSHGEATYALTIPPSASGRTVIFQAAEIGLNNTCIAISRPVEVTFQ